MFERLSEPDYQLTEDKCRGFVSDILSGVQHIHKQNIIHLNITPFNIIFPNKNEDTGLKIIDFGHSVQLSHGSEGVKLSQLQGTLEFLSPEVLRCDHVTRAADLWSVGVIIYMLVTGGVSPFFAGNRLKTMIK